MITLILATLLACPATKIENHTQIWNNVDNEHLAIATKRCTTLFSRSPCLKLFTKKAELEYVAICGAPSET